MPRKRSRKKAPSTAAQLILEANDAAATNYNEIPQYALKMEKDAENREECRAAGFASTGTHWEVERRLKMMTQPSRTIEYSAVSVQPLEATQEREEVPVVEAENPGREPSLTPTQS